MGLSPPDICRVLALVPDAHPGLRCLKLPIAWKEEHEDDCIAWTVAAARATELVDLTLCLNNIPRRDPVNFAFHLSHFTAAGSSLSFEWNDFSLPRHVRRIKRSPVASFLYWRDVDTKHVRQCDLGHSARVLRMRVCFAVDITCTRY